MRQFLRMKPKSSADSSYDERNEKWGDAMYVLNLHLLRVFSSYGLVTPGMVQGVDVVHLVLAMVPAMMHCVLNGYAMDSVGGISVMVASHKPETWALQGCWY